MNTPEHEREYAVGEGHESLSRQIVKTPRTATLKNTMVFPEQDYQAVLQVLSSKAFSHYLLTRVVLLYNLHCSFPTDLLRILNRTRRIWRPSRSFPVPMSEGVLLGYLVIQVNAQAPSIQKRGWSLYISQYMEMLQVKDSSLVCSKRDSCVELSTLFDGSQLKNNLSLQFIDGYTVVKSDRTKRPSMIDMVLDLPESRYRASHVIDRISYDSYSDSGHLLGHGQRHILTNTPEQLRHR